ncbi:hypothetical protein A3F62_02625 [Candidatus Woesebacteria bacterium RIFCSPHIGHO2_12_FULL_44_11]|uniref:alanine--tRNA ligase n=1 Tax=Candidatus Woesebacteria bacterium RIFCSPLOWO2_01_FULL_44_14 TaxID=1802525 RepID=A0A1F8C1D6_9BACT|nr:MAG: hypothetical protein A3F62_02625 [Candidatus Woesebacteria bacterium RIFCSPHIGHO2_12_FULL_44_11]OGM70147.1 MAG: hypothetical protein A2975_03670 [Candidatus Woesebacteria bacterium RIFCSPLOWO2_01_FULL_44_14]
MTTDEVREKYLKFFEARGHKRITPAPLVLENDPTTLFTSSGMQPLVPYLMGETHPEGKRLVDSQPSIRTVDIEEVGDNRHLTYFEMLGNWSLGDYFKEEQLNWIWEFFTEGLSLAREKLWITVFEGGGGVARDEESVEIWKKIGIGQERIFYYPAEKNWWSRSGTPEQMPINEIGGPTSEVFYEFESIKHDKKFGEKCHPNCDCGRFLEIGNSVFMVYKKTKDGLGELPNKNVDFGGGLERLVMAVNDNPDLYQIDVFQRFIGPLEALTGKSYDSFQREMRIVADHIRASEALVKTDVVPGNKLQGYVLRRLIRRAAVKMRNLKGNLQKTDLSFDFTDGVRQVVEEEVERFGKTLDRGLKEMEKIKKIDEKKAFDLYQSYGFPLEITQEIFAEKGQRIDKDKFEAEFEKHKEKSRTAAGGMFKGGLADKSEETTRFHTATHLLHESLRRVLGEHVQQKGSNITSERLRFDFSHSKKLTNEEIKKVEEMVNERITKNLPVKAETMTVKEALDSGALGFFSERYKEKVKAYSIGDFSKEICGGPHVAATGEIGRVRIIKEESLAAGVRRIYVSQTAQ